MSRRLQLILGLALAALLIWLFLRQADLAEVAGTLASADPWMVAAACSVTLVTAVQRAWRWQMLLSPLARIRLRPLLDAILIGWSVTTILPGRLGEIVRPVYLARKAPVRATAAFGTVVLERIFDAGTVLVLMALYLAFFPAPPILDDQGRMAMEAMRTTGLAALAFLCVGGAVAIWTLRSRAARLWIEQSARRWLPARVGELAVTFLEGLSGLRSPWLVARIAGASLVVWITILSSYVLLFRALDVQLPWYAAIPVLVLLVVGVMVPTPGAVGSFHKAAQIGLVGLWSVDNELAIAWAILSHATGFLLLGTVGLILALKEGLTPAEMSHMEVTEDSG